MNVEKFAEVVLGLYGVVAVGLIVCYFVGVIAAFAAVWWLGAVAMLLPPLGTFNGFVYVATWGQINLAMKLFVWPISC